MAARVQYEKSRVAATQHSLEGVVQCWKEVISKKELEKSLKGPHAPQRFRALGPLMNLDAFHEAFGIKPGDRLFKKKEARINIW